MHVVDGVFLGATALALLLSPTRGRAQWAAVVLVVGSVLAHWTVAGPRWPLAPAYLAIVLVPCVVWFAQADRRGPTRRGAILASFLGIATLGAAGGLAWLVPRPSVPPPTGPYEVGITRAFLTDSTRDEWITPEPGDSRELMVQVWYPASPDPDAETAKYMPEASTLIDAISERLGLPWLALFLHEFEDLATNSYLNVPVAEEGSPFPVVLHNHGGVPGNVFFNTELAEMLSSHGYVVVAIDHRWEAGLSPLPDGSVITLLHPYARRWRDELTAEAAASPDSLARVINDPDESPERRLEMMGHRLDVRPKRRMSLEGWTTDNVFVLDRLGSFHKEGRSDWAGHVDLGRIGVMGMSFGGAVAGRVCTFDSRCKASLNLDGSQIGRPVDPALLRPHMMIFHGQSAQFAKSDAFYGTVGSPYHRVIIDDVGHYSFIDGVWSMPATRIALPFFGSREPQQVREILAGYALAFFDRHLKGERSELLRSEPTWSGVRHEIRLRDAD